MQLPLDVAIQQYREVKAIEDALLFMCNHEDLWTRFEDWLTEQRNIKHICTCGQGHHPQVIGELLAMGLDYTRFQVGAIKTILKTQGLTLAMNGEPIND